MKKNIHPEYQKVLVEDISNGTKFLVGTTCKPKETKRHDGKEHPYMKVSVSSASHPYYTKKQKYIDTEGRVSKFQKRYANKTTPKSTS